MANNRTAVITALKKIFDERTENDEPVVPDKKKMYVDPSNTIYIIPKKSWVEAVLCEVFNAKQAKRVDLDYTTENEVPESSYATELFLMIMKLIEKYDIISIKLRKDFPLTIECDDFIVGIAPRVDYGR